MFIDSIVNKVFKFACKIEKSADTFGKKRKKSEGTVISLDRRKISFLGKFNDTVNQLL